VSLADEIRSRLGVDATAIPGSKGQFDVLSDGDLLFSKRAEGRFPDEDEILERLGS
jgi:selT/selW/selH-like putative selenoprotein